MTTYAPGGLYGVSITGLEEAIQRVSGMAAAARVIGRLDIDVGSPLPYAYGIEFGRTRGGRLARRAGGAFYMRSAAEEVSHTAPNTIINAIEQGGTAAQDIERVLGTRIELAAQRYVPVRTGALQRSIRYTPSSIMGRVTLGRNAVQMGRF